MDSGLRRNDGQGLSKSTERRQSGSYRGACRTFGRIALRSPASRSGAARGKMAEQNRQVLLKRRPQGMPVPEDFAIADAPLPEPGEGQVLLRGIYLSLDPYMRGRISGVRSYAKPVEIGDVIEGRVVGQVGRSRHPDFREGEYAFGGYGWQLYSAVDGAGLQKLDPAEAPLSTALGVLGMPGFTAYRRARPISASRSPAKPSSSRPPRARSARLPASWQSARARGLSGSPAAPTNAAMSRRNSVSTPASTIARPISARRSTPPARKGSMSISRMSAARCSRRCSRGSTILAAW